MSARRRTADDEQADGWRLQHQRIASIQPFHRDGQPVRTTTRRLISNQSKIALCGVNQRRDLLSGGASFMGTSGGTVIVPIIAKRAAASGRPFQHLLDQLLDDGLARPIASPPSRCLLKPRPVHMCSATSRGWPLIQAVARKSRGSSGRHPEWHP